MPDGKSTSVIGELYNAALQPGGWNHALRRLARVLDSDVGGIITQERTSGAAHVLHFHGLDRSAIKAYETYYGSISPTFQDSVIRPGGSVYTDNMYPDYAEYLRSEIYNDYFKPYSIDHLIQTQRGDCRSSVLTVCFRRGKGRSFYGEKEKLRFAMLEPHIRRAYALTKRMGAVEANRTAGLEVLNAMNDGVMLVDGLGRLRFANATAERILARCDGLAVSQGRLVAERGEETQRLRYLISGSIAFGRRPDLLPGGEMAVSRPSGKRDLLLSIAPVGARGYPNAPATVAAAVTITDPGNRPALPGDTLGPLFGLTPAEARLAAELATGDSLERVAERLGVTRETARTSLKRVFAKTDTHRQAELVRLLLSVPRTAEPRE